MQDFLIELDARKHASPSKPSELRRMKSEEFSPIEKLNIFNDYNPSPEYPPLFLFNNFKDQLDLSIEKGAVISTQEFAESIFIFEKFERQRVEREEAKKARKSAGRRRPGTSPRKREDAKEESKGERAASKSTRRNEEYKKELQKTEGLYIDMGAEYDEILEENQRIKSEAENLHKQIESLKRENAKLQDDLRDQRIEKQILEVK